MRISNKNDTILLTGITGNLGSFLAGEMLRSGNRVLALIRDKNEEIAKNRLMSSLAVAGIDELSNVEIIRGDICNKEYEINSNSSKLAKVSLVVHCAACTNFKDSKAQQSREANIEGTRNVLELAARLCVPIAYVSTAYIAGKRSGIVKEDEVDVGQEFNNIYEYTKCQAEKLVHSWGREKSLPTIVLRPSIVMGDAQYGRSVRFNSMYDIIRVLDLILPHLGNECIRIPCKPDATKNMITVDYFAMATWHIIRGGIVGNYHITNPSPMKIRDMCEMFSNLFGITQYEMVNDNDFSKSSLSTIGNAFKEATSIYNSYMVDEPVFDRQNTDRALADTDIKFPLMDLSYFERLLEYARSVSWGRIRHNLVSAR